MKKPDLFINLDVLEGLQGLPPQSVHTCITSLFINLDVLEGLQGLPPQSVHTCITSPPYYGLRDYGVDGQIGLEVRPEEYIDRLMKVFREVRRVLRNDGTLWLNLGDSYARRTLGRNDNDFTGKPSGRAVKGMSRKNLLGIPFRVAFALQDDGWILRSDIIWHKPNSMPESVRDRPTKAHEYLFLFSKKERYYYDQDAIKEPSVKTWTNKKFSQTGRSAAMFAQDPVRMRTRGIGTHHEYDERNTRNKRSVWTIPTKPYKEAHFATFPPALVEPCLLAGTSAMGCCPKCGSPWRRVVQKTAKAETYPAYNGKNRPDENGIRQRAKVEGGSSLARYDVHTVGWEPTCNHQNLQPVPCTVLDPFMGSGTVGEVAALHGRRFIGIDLNEAYWALAFKRNLKALMKRLRQNKP